MPKRSAGLLLFRRSGPDRVEVLLVHPGGPFFRNKDEGTWTLPKGEIESGEDPLTTAKRELAEETGFDLTADGEPFALGEVRQRGGKIVLAWAVEASVEPARLESNTFEIEWPPRSGRRRRFPEIDRAEYFPLGRAREKINPVQIEFLDRLENALRTKACSNENGAVDGRTDGSGERPRRR